MVNTAAIFIAGAIAAGAAVAGVLFLLYPDMMLGQSSLRSQSGGSGLGSPQNTAVAGNGPSSSNSTGTTTGAPYAPTP